MNVVVANDLTKSYKGVKALRGINIEIPEGEIYGILGPSGCGKTTMLKLLTGFMKPDFGSCSVLGLSSQYEGEKIRGKTGIFTETAKNYGYMSAYDNLIFYAKLSGLNDYESKERASLLMHRFNIWDDKDKLAIKMKTDELQKLSICRTLVSNPKLLILDGAFNGMDKNNVNDATVAVKEIAQREGISVLILTDQTPCIDICTTVAVMIGGKIVSKGNIENLLKTAGLKHKATIRTADNKLSFTFDKFIQNENKEFEKEINDENEMAEIISRSVMLGNKLIEAKITTPSLEEIYDALLKKEIDDEKTDK
jgi:ABC-2 type transport system ATP-binding protein